MSTELPPEFSGSIYVLEQQAIFLQRQGHYKFSERIFRAMLETILEYQMEKRRRVHKGSFYHNIGFSQLLQGKETEALEDFLLAYIEDCLTFEAEEGKADSLPAGTVLRHNFLVENKYLEMIKKIAQTQRDDDDYNPNRFLDAFLEKVKLTHRELASICEKPPNAIDIIKILVVTLTPEAKNALDRLSSQTTNRVIEKAAEIARKRGRETVTADDVREASAIVEREP